MPVPPRRQPSSSRPFRHRPRKRPPEALPPEFADAARGIRLQKVLAAAGVASRRDCEAMITDGRVTVNGQRITALPAWVDPARDRIEVNGHVVSTAHRAAGHASRAGAGSGSGGPEKRAMGAGGKAHPGQRVYAMLNKPRRVISTTDDPEGRQTVTDMVQIEDLSGPRRLFPVGRLQAELSGLILLTDDGELANRLMHPRYGITKEYQVSVRGEFSEADLRRLRSELNLPQRLTSSRPTSSRPPTPGSRGLQGGKTEVNSAREFDRQLTPAQRATMESVSVIKRQRDVSTGDRTLLRVVLREGKNREIRLTMARLGLKVRRLQRVAIGPLRLKTLSSGHWRLLTADEVRTLRHAAGL